MTPPQRDVREELRDLFERTQQQYDWALIAEDWPAVWECQEIFDLITALDARLP